VDIRARPDQSYPAVASSPALRFDGPVVVTGGAGFLGQETVRQLRALGCTDIRVVDLLPFPGGEHGDLRSVVADVRDADLTEAFRGAETVLHLAACQYHSPLAKSTYELPFRGVNVEGTRAVLAAAKKASAKRFVFVSTNMVYGLPQRLPLDETHARDPFGPYGQSKLEAEKLVKDAHDAGLDSAIVRPGLIVGPGRVGVMVRIFEWIFAGRPVVLIGNGRNRYELIASEDVASLVLHAAAARGFGAYNAGSREVPMMREWIEHVIERAGSRSRIVGLPGGALKAAFRVLESVRLSPLRKDQYLIADIDYYMDSTLAQRTLGWAPKWTGIDAAMSTFEWYARERDRMRAVLAGGAASS
jgi:dTDP-glucose 4,6-dehydratase